LKGKLIVFRLLGRVGYARTMRFCREFYGYTDYSNRGRYRYLRSGFLNKIPHVRIMRNVLLVRREDGPRVVDFLKRHRAEVHEWSVKLRPQDEVGLGLARRLAIKR
jgi:hypothetical protein